ncbi:unnamed protein product [Jaminaea pallidilutea]
MASQNQSNAAAANPKPFQTKLVLLGEAAVGKSSVVLRFVSNEFAENKQPTIGAAFLTQKCRLEDKIIKFEIWDTAGQERFHSLAPMYYRNAQASAVIYDVTKASSFEKAKSWVKELQRQANPNIVIALVGNKIDLLSASSETTKPQEGSKSTEDDENDNDDDEDDQTTVEGTSAAAADGSSSSSPSSLRAVPQEEAKAYADESGLLFFETSAKTGEGVIDVFTEIAKKINPQDIQQQQQQQQGGQGRGGSNNGGGGANGGQNAGARASGNGQVNLQDGQQRRQDACNC